MVCDSYHSMCTLAYARDQKCWWRRAQHQTWARPREERLSYGYHERVTRLTQLCYTRLLHCSCCRWLPSRVSWQHKIRQVKAFNERAGTARSCTLCKKTSCTAW